MKTDQDHKVSVFSTSALSVLMEGCRTVVWETVSVRGLWGFTDEVLMVIEDSELCKMTNRNNISCMQRKNLKHETKLLASCQTLFGCHMPLKRPLPHIVRSMPMSLGSIIGKA